MSLRFWLGPADDTKIYWLWETSSPSAHGEEWVHPSHLQQSCPETGQWSPGESQVNLILINIYDNILWQIIMTSLFCFSPQRWDKELTFKGSYNAKLTFSALVNTVNSHILYILIPSWELVGSLSGTGHRGDELYLLRLPTHRCEHEAHVFKATIQNPAKVWARAPWISCRCLIGFPHAIKNPLLPNKGKILIMSSARSIARICVDSSHRFLGDGPGPDKSKQHCSLGWGATREIRMAQLTGYHSSEHG